MAFNVGVFKALTEYRGHLQNNKYDVRIYFESPKLGASFISNFTAGTVATRDVARDLSYRCVSASLPGLTLKSSDVNRFGLGVQEKMPYSGNYTDISLSFTCDKFGAAYNFWYSWINYIFAINGQVTNSVVASARRPYYTTEYKDNYAATIVINVYDNNGFIAMQYVLYKAFPTSINDISVGWGDNNQLMKITTNVTFREWALEGGNSVLMTPENVPVISTQRAVPTTN
jgi:hypothetical protein